MQSALTTTKPLNAVLSALLRHARLAACDKLCLIFAVLALECFVLCECSALAAPRPGQLVQGGAQTDPVCQFPEGVVC